MGTGRIEAHRRRLAASADRHGQVCETSGRRLDALDSTAVQAAHETMADLGLDRLNTEPQKVAMLHVTQMDDATLQRFGDAQAQLLRKRIAQFEGVTPTPLPDSIKAELRHYQKAGFDFPCRLTRSKLGAIP